MSLKSTIVRSILQGQWTATALLGKVDPHWAGQLAVELALRPRRCRTPRLAALDKPHYQYRLSCLGEEVAIYRWNGPGPKVLLSHGWNSSALKLYPLVEALREQGYEVWAFDHLGHGKSSGRRASLPRFARVLESVQENYGPFDAAIGHSMGGLALAVTRHRRQLSLPLVLLAPPPDVRPWFVQLARKLGFSEVTYAHMEQVLQRQEQVDLDSILPEKTMPEAKAASLILVGQLDSDVSRADAQRYLLGPLAEFEEMEGLDHRQIFTDSTAHQRVLDWLVTTLKNPSTNR